MAYTAIDNPELHFQAELYVGTGSAFATTLDGDEDMQPDLVWLKDRSGTGYHCLMNAIRGATKNVYVNDASVEDTDSFITSFNSDGFTIGAGNSDSNHTDADHNYVAWCWKANGTGSSNTEGSINTTATSANTTAGFSIVSYTGTGSGGATIGHGLGLVPDFIITKNLVTSGGAGDWHTFHGANTTAPETDYLMLNKTNATTDHNQRWNDTMPTTTLVEFGDDSGPNQSGSATMAYIWTGIQGFSKFGSYTGNGDDPDGPFCWCGFSPQLVIIKRTDSADDWKLHTKKIEVHNPINQSVKANGSDAEASEGDHEIDFYSNGFQLKENNSAFNASGGTYVFCAWAEAPFVNSNGVPCNAR